MTSCTPVKSCFFGCELSEAYFVHMANEVISMDFDLLVVGEINPDLILRGDDVTPTFGQAEKVIQSATLTIGSSSVITACGAARLGMRTAFIGVVGNDHFGHFMLEAMAERGIDISACKVDDALATGLSVILTRPGDRAILTYPGTIPVLSLEQVDQAYLRQTRHLHVSSYFLLDQLRPQLPVLFARAKGMGVTTSLDTNWDPTGLWNSGLDRLWPYCDLFLPNAAEAQKITAQETIEDAVNILSRQIPTVAVKLGAKGGLARQGSQEIHQPAYAVDVVDSVGAGDSFNAGFLYGYIHGWTLEANLLLATACGALSTRGSGGTAAQPTLQEAQVLAGVFL